VVDNHTHRTLRGVSWNFLRVLGQMALLFAVNAVLARLLAPSDFGLLTAVMIFIGFADLVASLGMGPAIVERQNLTELHLRVALTLSLIVGTLLLAALLLLAPLLARSLDEPEITAPVQVLAIGLWFTALAAPSRGRLTRAMDFKRLLWIDLGSYALGYAGIGISLALLGFGAWSLVFGSLVSLVCSALAAMLFQPPHLPLSLARKELRELVRFGGGVSLNSVINYLAANVDYLVIGRILGQTALGLYSQAYRLITLPVSKIAATLSAAMFPSFAEIRGDTRRLRRAYLRAVGATALTTFPILIACLAAAEPVVVGFFGEQWRPAAASFRILTLAGMLKAVFHLAGPLAQASGRVYAEVWRQAIYLGILAAGCLAAVPFGIEGISWAVVIGSFWMYLAMAHLARQIVECDWAEFFAAQRPGLLLGLLVALAEGALLYLDEIALHLPAPALLAALVVICGLTLGASLLVLPASVAGDFPPWMLARYGDRLPERLRVFLARRWPQ